MTNDDIDVQFREITRDNGTEQIRKAVAGAIVTATIAGGLTWIGWIIPTVAGWWTP